jgi:carboxyl-terminal processing protease
METKRARGLTFGVAGVVAALGGVAFVGSRALHPAPRGPDDAPANAVIAPADSGARALSPEGDDDERTYAFRVPSGDPASLSCEEARRIVAQVRGTLAYEPDRVSPRALATGTADWLDPHGLWSAAPDAPVAGRIEARAADLAAEMEGRANDGCAAAKDVGASLVKWVTVLRAGFDRARDGSTSDDPALAAEGVPFDSATETKSAVRLAADLGERVGAFARGTGPSGKAYADAARDRYFPPLDADGWSRVVLAAAVRAYVPLVDPHGAWAPFDEEASVYEVDLASHPPLRVWDRYERSAIGLRIGEGATEPLAEGDLLLSMAGVITAGLPLEQLDQLAFVSGNPLTPPEAVVMRRGERTTRTLRVTAPDPGDVAGTDGEHDLLPVARVPYGAGDALVIAIHDVRDDLGEALARTILEERHKDGRPLAGVVLDLRGNGGGSTDGAIAALGLFLPGAPLFPMKRRDGTLETDRAPEPPQVDRWTGPVATLIDGTTASAAEMIAGALAVYRRGAAVGATTYGKGCAQEYLDDDAHAGVLRLTTLIYALPDGAPVQRVGLTPTIAISLDPAMSDASITEREATLLHAAPTWRGPDVRERRDDAFATWPSNAGNVGPCKDADVCRALRTLGGASAKRTSTTKSR